ncbi:MAG TPA: dihydroorotate dehydrogenase-like protein [Anaerolineales bacterium]|nr:dihydroorotate dehydrogenase-like protein [Anaerolineales bacterium]
MADLTTTYMGIPLSAPLVVAASSVSNMVDRVRLAEQAGAGALVIRSLFEEQIQIDALRMQESLQTGAESTSEARTYFPEIQPGMASEHLHWVEKTRAAVQMPLIGSLNAATPGSWVAFARQLEAAGVNALELNIYAVAADPRRDGRQIEQELLDIVAAVRSEVSVPLAVKLSPFYTAFGHVAHTVDKAGADALVLFNRFLQPDIDPATETPLTGMVLSTPDELRLPLRWTALLYGRIGAEIALSTGVHSGVDAAKALLAGAQVVQTASALLQHGIPFLSTMLRQLEGWMEEHGYARLEEFRGKLSQRESPDPFAYERAQYVRLLSSQK